MRRPIMISALVCGSLGAGQASAQDRLLDLSQPQVVVQALQEAGYKAVLKQNSKGEPYVSSAANGSPFTIEFYACASADKQKDCPSYQFSSWYKPDPIFTIALANEWNLGKRFLKVAVGTDGSLSEYMDATATGKTTQANFADLVDWYQTMDSDLAKFIDEKRKPPAK